MGKVNVYFPDDLEQQMRDKGIQVSPICQEAVKVAIRNSGACPHLHLRRGEDDYYYCARPTCGERVL